MEALIYTIGIIGWVVAGVLEIRYLRQRSKPHCPRCNRRWKKSNNVADDTYVCKCGMTTYDRNRYVAEFRDRSENY